MNALKRKLVSRLNKETNRARDQLRAQVAALAIAGAEKILQAEVNANAHAAMLNQLATSHNSLETVNMAELTTVARPYAKAAFEYANAQGASELTIWSNQLALAATIVQDADLPVTCHARA